MPARVQAAFLLALLNHCSAIAPAIPADLAAAQATGDLKGMHLHITSVHDAAAMNMMDAAGNMLPWEEWKGFTVDVIQWVSRKAGFTYTLHSASGYGKHCPKKEDGSMFPQAHYKGMYNCAGNDVYCTGGVDGPDYDCEGFNVPPENQTHIFWAMAYITPWRLDAMLFTTPVLSDVGISMVMVPDIPTVWGKSAELITPFTTDMWLLSMMTLLIVSFVMWFTNHAGTVDSRMKLAEELPELYGRYKSRLTSGYMTTTQFAREVPPSLANGIHTMITGPSAFTTQSAHAGILNVAVSVFAMVWMLVYGAQLCSSLTVTKLTVPVSGLSDPSTGLVAGQLSGLTGLACSQGGAAYTNWVKKNFPLMQLNENGVLLSEMMDEMKNGQCDSILVVAPLTGSVTANCALGAAVGGVIQKVGTPLPFGPQDMAAGVRKDMQPVAVAISYWIQQLRGCNPTTNGSPCYNELNMLQLYDKWHNTVNCPTGKSGASSIDYVNFLYVFIICWVGSGLAFFWEVSQLRYRDRMVSLFKGNGLWQCVTEEPFKCVNPKTGALSLTRLRKAFKVSYITACQGDTASYLHVLRCLRRYYVGPDLNDWQTALATDREMATEMKILGGSGDVFVSAGSNKVRLMLDTHTGKLEKASARIGIFWRNRAQFKATNLRMHALLEIQERLLMAAVSATIVEQEKASRDKKAKMLSGNKVAPSQVAPTK